MLESVGDPGNQFLHSPFGDVGQSQSCLQAGLLLGQLLGKVGPARVEGVQGALEGLTVGVLTGKTASELGQQKRQRVLVGFLGLDSFCQMLRVVGTSTMKR